MDDKYRSRKYAIAVTSMLGIHVALFSGFIGGSEYITGLGLIIGLYGASNIGEKYAGR